MPVAFERVAPVLPVLNVVRALERYRRLGFQTTPYVMPGLSSEESPSYGFLRPGPVEIHLSAFSALDPKTSTAVCFLWVDDADAVHAEWAAAGVDGELRAPFDTPYGMREFGYVDPDGNRLRIGSSLRQT